MILGDGNGVRQPQMRSVSQHALAGQMRTVEATWLVSRWEMLSLCLCVGGSGDVLGSGECNVGEPSVNVE